MSRRALLVFLPFALTALVFAATVSAGAGELEPDNTPPIFTSDPGDITREATSPNGASVDVEDLAQAFDPFVPGEDGPSNPVDVDCSPNGQFQLGVTQGSCTARDAVGNTTQQSVQFTVTVHDTTPPTVTPPANVTVTDTAPFGSENVAYGTGTASDIVDGSLQPACLPVSGSSFTVGQHTVTCTATDSSSNTGSASFTVTVEPPPNTPPTIDVSGPSTVEASGPGGGSLTYAYTASDAEDPGQPSVSCDQAVGASIAVDQALTVTCTATDSQGASTPDAITQTAVDTKPPVVSVPGNITAASTGPSGASVSFSASASDLVDGSVSASCNPGTGTFPVGVTLVTCTATDSHHNTGSNSFSVSVQDEDAPTVTVPASRTVEANGPSGSVVSYEQATATDTTGGSLTPTCFPLSGSTFGLGTWQVTCTATDAARNVGSASFTIRVVDTAAPVLTAPADLAVQSTGPVAATDSRIKAFLGGATATDIVDTSPAVTTNAPSSFPVGVTTVTFTARDDAGNTTQKGATVTVSPDPPGQPGGDTTPPANVGSVRAILGNLAVSLSWKPPANDFDHVDVVQSPAPGGGEKVVYSGKKKSFVAKGLTNGVEYRFVVVAYDKVGNRASGVAVVALAQQQTLLAPPNGAVISAAPLVKWKPAKGAKYYNAQIWFEPTGSGRVVLASTAARKVMSVWPTKASFKMKKSWRFGGKKFTLKQGRYLLYIWPGVGPKSANRYGKLLVQAEFTISRG